MQASPSLLTTLSTFSLSGLFTGMFYRNRTIQAHRMKREGIHTKAIPGRTMSPKGFSKHPSIISAAKPP